MLDKIRSSGLLKHESDLEKLDEFIVALRLMGYYIDIMMNKYWASVNIRVTREVYHIRSIIIVDVLINVTDGEIDQLFVKYKNKNGDTVKLYHDEYKPEYLGESLKEALIYI